MTKTALRLWALPVALAATLAPAQADPFKNAAGASVTFKGQIDVGVLAFDDGGKSRTDFVDNANSNSRVGFGLEWPMATGDKLKFGFETSLGFAQSSADTISGFSDWYSWNKTNLRKVELSYESKAYGTFWAGQGSMATDGVAEVDQSKTSVVSYSAIADTAGGFALRTGAGALSSVKIKDVFVNLDGSRKFRLRYDTPAYKGLTLSVAVGKDVLTTTKDKYYDISVRYDHPFGDLKLQSAVGYSMTDRGAGAKDQKNVLASVSVLHEPTGLNGTLAAGKRINGGHYTYAKLGWTKKLIDAGSTSVGVEYYRSDDFASVGTSGKLWGLMAVQALDKQKLELYAGWRRYSVDQPGKSYQDASSVLAGLRWKF